MVLRQGPAEQNGLVTANAESLPKHLNYFKIKFMNVTSVTRYLLTMFAIILITSSGSAQQKPLTGRAAALKAKESVLIYPFFQGSSNFGVMPVENPSFPYMHKGKTKLVFDMGREAEKGQVNPGLEEIMRILNLHGAAGVKKSDLDVYVVVHGPGAASFLDDDVFNKQFQVNNPNLPLVKQLQDAGVKLVACGQTLGLRNMNIASLPDGTLLAYSAKTAISDLVQRGFMLYNVTIDQ
jgi:intracellular sulfur oxidation DsrE/DsrF family protein